MILIILSSLLLLAAVIWCFIPRGWSAVCAFAGMLLLWLSGTSTLHGSQLWFWGAAAMIVLGLSVLLPTPVVYSRRGVGYLVIGTIAGLFVGVLISQAAMVLGGVAGAFCAAMAYSRTPAGKMLHFPSYNFLNFLCAKALPPVITLSIVAVTLLSLFSPMLDYLN